MEVLSQYERCFEAYQDVVGEYFLENLQQFILLSAEDEIVFVGFEILVIVLEGKKLFFF